MAYLLLLLGIVPLVSLLWFYIQFIHPNRARLAQTLNRLSLPNKAGVISLGIAVIAFLYSILYSSISTYYTLEAVASAESSGAEQRAAFNKQMDLMQKQQTLMQKQQNALEDHLGLAQKQIENLNDIKSLSKTGAELSKSQLELTTSLAERDIYLSNLVPEITLSLSNETHKKPFSQKELDSKLVTIKPSNKNVFVSTIYVSNISRKEARNLTISIRSLPESVQIYGPPNPTNPQKNLLYIEDYINYVLTNNRIIAYSFFSVIPPDVDKVTYTFRLSCDSPNSTREFKYDFIVDHSLQSK